MQLAAGYHALNSPDSVPSPHSVQSNTVRPHLTITNPFQVVESKEYTVKSGGKQIIDNVCFW